ncbi:hypothetical protein EMCG_06662 [[Emmonsia] crescens]|uniref:Uncharacterized protein n=1 Tax=[Emmonsia] crescens TaxID=73230 RepID=A0A0G2IAR1_9EURO|nr:hypothetical protein EMCG_06662 [Emmonsia crescens UAMH 3008]
MLEYNPHIPTAKHSTLTALTFLPTTSSTYHPTISHSHLYSLTLDNLSPSTSIRHTLIRHTTVKSNKSRTESDSSNNEESSSSSSSSSENGSSTISQSHIAHCTILGSSIDCSSLRKTTLSNAEYVSGSQIRNSTLSGTGRISQCKMRHSQCLRTPDDNNTAANTVTNTTKTTINKSEIRDSIIGPLPCTINRSRLRKVKISQSTIKDACLDDCDIDGCRILKGKFSGLWLRNGIWEGGELVGKVKEGEEVVVKARGFAEIEERERERERERIKMVEEGGEMGIGIGVGVGVDKGFEDPGSADAGRGAQGNNAMLVGRLSRESSDSKRRLQDDDTLFTLKIQSTQMPWPRFDAAAHDDQQRYQQASPLPSKEQPHISMNEDYHPSPSTDGYSSAAESLLDPDEDRESAREDFLEVEASGIVDEKPPPYAP